MNSNRLDNYRQLVERVDQLCRGISDTLGDQITCTAGCSACCTSITLFPVEAAALAEALNALPQQEKAAIRQQVQQQAEGERCPLLSNDHCLLYEARPIICRTHGLPILIREDGRQGVDCCPSNTLRQETISGATVIDLERLNTVLVTVNALFLSQNNSSATPERLTIAQAVLAAES